MANHTQRWNTPTKQPRQKSPRIEKLFDYCQQQEWLKKPEGKSNLFEALIEIFRHLDEFDSAGDGIDFDYGIAYEIKGKSTLIEWKDGQLKINGRYRKTLGKTTPLPDNILVYYSGHNDTVTSLIDKYVETFRRRLRLASASEDRFFIGVDSDYKELLLTKLAKLYF